MATNRGGPKQQQITKNNRFEKQQLLKISLFRKQHNSKTTTNEKNSKFQKNSNFRKQQISKNSRSQKTKNDFLFYNDMIFLDFSGICLLSFLINVYFEICCFLDLFFMEKIIS